MTITEGYMLISCSTPLLPLKGAAPDLARRVPMRAPWLTYRLKGPEPEPDRPSPIAPKLFARMGNKSIDVPRYPMLRCVHLNQRGNLNMNKAQRDYLDNLTISSANALLRKFGHDPARAFAAGWVAYNAFCWCWEFANDGEYVQRYNGANGIEYHFCA